MSDLSNPIAGVLWVSSAITQPHRLSHQTFADWYENTHIGEVLATGGVPAAARYETPDASEANRARRSRYGWVTMDAPYLTIYEMPDVNFRHSATFKGLDGQSKPKGNLLEEIFSNAVFETRFCRELFELSSEKRRNEVNDDMSAHGGGIMMPAQCVVSETYEVIRGSKEEKDFWKWTRLGHTVAPRGWIKSRWFEVVDSTILDEFRRRDGVGSGERVAFMGLHEFDDENLLEKGLEEIKRWEPDVQGAEIGVFRRKRLYGEFEKMQTGGMNDNV